MYKIPGHHHISMITKNVSENNHFYRDVLGLRRVKITVNQDDPSMYHLFYGDKTGSPGTELSFFEMPTSWSYTPWYKCDHKNWFTRPIRSKFNLLESTL